jgi:protoporphyrinogen/coproporphyrinogen III oxidase
MKRVIIIGGGITGLAAAFKVRRAAEADGHEVTFTLVEKDDRLGGKIASEVVDDFIIDGGPDSFLTEKPALHRIADLLGMADKRLPSDESRKKTWILAAGKLHEMPDGIMMFAPTKFVPFATTGLFSPAGKARMAMDLVIPKKQVPEGELNDETLESFVVRRMGRECLDRLAEPLVGGVHASDPAVMSLAATFPRLLEMEQKHGSLMLAFLDARKKVEEMRRKYPPKPGQPRRTFFSSFEGGMQELTDAMADAAGRDDMIVGTAVASLERAGSGWVATLADGRKLDGDAVVVATEGWAAEGLVRDIAPLAYEALEGIPHSSSATISLGFDTEDVGFDLNAFGVLCPQAEHRSLMAATYSSTKWPDRAPKGKVLMRGFVGGPHNQEIVDRSDDELTQIVTDELRGILGLTADPIFARVYRWRLGMPQYTLGHLGRVAAIQSEMETIPGLALAGGSYTGVGLPNCAESGEAAVSKVLSDLGVTLSEDEAPKTCTRH